MKKSALCSIFLFLECVSGGGFFSSASRPRVKFRKGRSAAFLFRRHGAFNNNMAESLNNLDFSESSANTNAWSQKEWEYDQMSNRRDIDIEQETTKSVVEKYTQTPAQNALVALSASVCGSLLGLLLSAYVVNKPKACMITFALLGGLFSFLEGIIAEFSRAIGVALIIVITKWREFTAQFPLFLQLRAALIRRRHPFPSQNQQASFSKSLCTISSGSIGGLIGYSFATWLNLFLVPPSIIALIFGFLLAYASTLDSCDGDLIRCLSMKGVGIIGLLWSSASETGVFSVAMKVFQSSLRRANWINRKLLLTDRFTAFMSWILSLFQNGNPATNSVPPPSQDFGLNSFDPASFMKPPS